MLVLDTQNVSSELQAHEGKYPGLQTVPAGGKWTESFWVRASGI